MHNSYIILPLPLIAPRPFDADELFYLGDDFFHDLSSPLFVAEVVSSGDSSPGGAGASVLGSPARERRLGFALARRSSSLASELNAGTDRRKTHIFLLLLLIVSIGGAAVRCHLGVVVVLG